MRFCRHQQVHRGGQIAVQGAEHDIEGARAHDVTGQMHDVIGLHRLENLIGCLCALQIGNQLVIIAHRRRRAPHGVDLRAQRAEPSAQRGTDEAPATGYQNPLTSQRCLGIDMELLDHQLVRTGVKALRARRAARRIRAVAEPRSCAGPSTSMKFKGIMEPTCRRLALGASMMNRSLSKKG